MDRTTKRGRSAPDRISNLPSNVIDDILKYLPLHDAVRTSILSRGWQYKWVTIPYLVFDKNFKQKLLGKYNSEFIIYQVLVLHKGPIVKFTYEVYDDFNSCRPVAHHCLHFLSNYRIEELTLDFSYSPAPKTMPHHLFTFDQLRHLSLFNCNLRPPSTFKGFGRLVTLALIKVLIEPVELTRFISKCPMLEHLNLCSYIRNFANIEIDAPNLKSFCSSLYMSLSISFKNTSFLEQVSITFYGRTSPEQSQGSQSNLIEYFGHLSSIEKLKLYGGSLQWLARSGVPQNLPNNLTHLSFLLCDVNFVTRAEVACAVCLIRSSPNLKSLEIKSLTTRLTTSNADMESAAQFLKEQQNYKLTLPHLEHVKIDLFSGSEPEMEFVKLLLWAATALIKLELKLNHYLRCSAEEESRILKELARYRRASSNAEIIIT